MRYLKDQPADLPEAFMFLAGINEWRRKGDWPPKDLKPLTLFFRSGNQLSIEQPKEPGQGAFDEYLSDANRWSSVA